VRLARVSVREENVADLATAPLSMPASKTQAMRSLTRWTRGVISSPLSITDREAILRVLDDPPHGLAELRGVLLAEHEGRVRARPCVTA